MDNEVSVRKTKWLHHKWEKIPTFIYLTKSRLKYGHEK